MSIPVTQKLEFLIQRWEGRETLTASSMGSHFIKWVNCQILEGQGLTILWSSTPYNKGAWLLSWLYRFLLTTWICACWRISSGDFIPKQIWLLQWKQTGKSLPKPMGPSPRMAHQSFCPPDSLYKLVLPDPKRFSLFKAFLQNNPLPYGKQFLLS